MNDNNDAGDDDFSVNAGISTIIMMPVMMMLIDGNGN